MSTPLLITSENARFQQTLALKENREKRSKLGLFIVEGVISITRMLRARWVVDAWWYSRGTPLSDWARDSIAQAPTAQRIELAPELMAKLSDKEDVSELLATVRIPLDDPARIPLTGTPLVVLFDRPQSPGNLGSSIRSCDALGAAGVLISGHAADPYHPQSVRGSMGSIFAVPIARLASHQALVDWLERAREIHPNLTIVGTSAEGAIDCRQHNFRTPTLLVMGNESSGMCRAYAELCEATIKIPQHGVADSLNVACATSVLLYEAFSQRNPIALAVPGLAD